MNAANVLRTGIIIGEIATGSLTLQQSTITSTVTIGTVGIGGFGVIVGIVDGSVNSVVLTSVVANVSISVNATVGAIIGNVWCSGIVSYTATSITMNVTMRCFGNATTGVINLVSKTGTTCT